MTNQPGEIASQGTHGPGAPHVLEEHAPAGVVTRPPDGVISRPDALAIGACAHCPWTSDKEPNAIDVQRALAKHLATVHSLRGRLLVHLLGVSSSELLE